MDGETMMSFFMIVIGVVIGWMIAEYVVIRGFKSLWRHRRQVQKSGPNSINIQSRGSITIDGQKMGPNVQRSNEPYKTPDERIKDDLKRNTLE